MQDARREETPFDIDPCIGSGDFSLPDMSAARPTVHVLDLGCPAPDAWTDSQIGRFIEMLDKLAGQPGIQAVILTGPRLFEGGHSRSSNGRDAMEAVRQAIADCPIAIVAAIPKDATGAGLELAVACAARVSGRVGRFSMAGISGGRLPGASTLRELSRLVGIEAAASLVALGRPMDGAEARAVGLLDAVALSDLLDAAHELVAELPQVLADRGPEPDAIDVQAQFFAFRRALRRDAPDQVAPLAAVQAMEAAVLLRPRRAPTEVARISGELEASPQGAALRYSEQGDASLRDKVSRECVDEFRLASPMRWPLAREAIHLLDEGASPAQIDRCLTRYGFTAGPFAQSDAVGFALVFSNGDAVVASGADWIQYSPTLDLMVDAGRLGGDAPGWYRPVGDCASARFDPDVDQLIQSSSLSQRLHRKPLADERIVDRCLHVSIASAFAMHQEHPELAASEIDAIWRRRLGFPRWKGGPLYQAREIGLAQVALALQAFRRPRDTIGPIADLLICSSRAGIKSNMPPGQRSA
jgi:enoyl-CoA hydratase/carnithine racemase